MMGSRLTILTFYRETSPCPRPFSHSETTFSAKQLYECVWVQDHAVRQSKESAARAQGCGRGHARHKKLCRVTLGLER